MGGWSGGMVGVISLAHLGVKASMPTPTLAFEQQKRAKATAGDKAQSSNGPGPKVEPTTIRGISMFMSMFMFMAM